LVQVVWERRIIGTTEFIALVVIDLSEVVLQWIPVAAIATAAVAYIFREIEDWRSRKRERKGLLRLLAVEIEYNKDILEAFKNPRLAPGEHPQVLHTHAWEENRSRIAQLLERGDDFGDLADYFMNIASFEEYRRSGQEWAVTLSEYIPSLEQQGKDAMNVINRGTGGKVEPRVEVPALEAEVPALKAPTEASREAAETTSEPPEKAEPHPATEEAQEPAWRRWRRSLVRGRSR
jgi:hypothetical protein